MVQKKCNVTHTTNTPASCMSALSEAISNAPQEVNTAEGVFIITGLSGAGKSTAVHVFEDLGYFTVDGLPTNLVQNMVAMMGHVSMQHFKGIALGMDLRNSSIVEDIRRATQKMYTDGLQPCIIFIEAQETVLLNRYAASRRPHPLEREGMGLDMALAVERQRLAPLRQMANMVLDTSHFSIHELRQALQKRWGNVPHRLRTLKVNIVSFGFKYGVPREAEFVFDLRFLPNPYFDTSLRPLSGQDSAVVDYVFQETKGQIFLQRLIDFLLSTLPLIEEEGRYRLTLALGCTGGQHRSVATAEHIRKVLAQSDYAVSLEHRHVEVYPR